MSLQVKGISSLIDELERKARVQISAKALKKAGDVVLKKEKEIAKERHSKYSNDVGYKHLKRFNIRKHKGSSYIDVGIKGEKQDWEKIKGIYYNHYGFWHNGYRSSNTRGNREKKGVSSGVYVAGSAWMDDAYEQSKEEACEILMKEMLKEVID